MSLWTSAEIAAATRGTQSADFAVTGVAFDSREVGPGDLFVALKGEETDGHRFLAQAFAQGAAGAVVSEPCSLPHVLVADTAVALDDLGRASRARTAATVIGVTGSVGKTSAKEALAAALERGAPGEAAQGSGDAQHRWKGGRGAVHRSVKSYNNHVGVPLSLARMPRDSRFAVLEMGMNHAGELAALTGLVRPHVAIVTAIASAHLEFFANEEAIADAKGEIFAGLMPGGTAIVPYDSRHRDRLIAAARPFAGRIVTFGFGEGADVRAVETMRTGAGSFITARLGGESDGRGLSFTLSQPGAHWVSNALAVIAAVDAAGADLGLAGLALADLNDLPGRGARVRVAVAGGTALMIDESYNANPASMLATLRVLADEPGRHIAVLGAMAELGEGAAALHAELAQPVIDAAVETAVLVGEAMASLAAALEQKVNVVHVADAAAAGEALAEMLRPGDAVLVKGSHSVGLSRVVAQLAEGGVD